MANTYVDVSWGTNEPLDTNKLNTMAQNVDYLFKRMPKVYFNAYNAQRDIGVKIACGVATIPPTSNYSTTVTVYFGTFFTPGSQPIITTSITSSYNRRVIDTINGISGNAAMPDHRGFIAHIAAVEFNDKTNALSKTMHLNWIAMGY